MPKAAIALPLLHLLLWLLLHAYRTLLTNVYAGLTIGALLSIYYCMLLSSMWCTAGVVLDQANALHCTFLYTHARSFLFPSFTAVTLLQIYHCGHFFSSHSFIYSLISAHIKLPSPYRKKAS